jgi:L-threonylcarbamoyladenylate synthase
MLTTGKTTMPAKIIKVGPDNILSAIEQAVTVIKDGGLVAFPTESFYALGADALNPLAIEWVYRAKRRMPHKPLPVIIHDKSLVEKYARDLSPAAKVAVEQLMPGPVTLVLWAADNIPENLSASTGKIGIRVPDHTVASELSRLFGGPIIATSANISEKSPGLTTAGEVMDAVGSGIELILDCGPTPGPPASTLIDLTSDPPVLMREGRAEKSSIEKVLGPLKS